MLKQFLIKKMLSKQLKGMPKEEQDKILSMVENNPQLFQKIALEIKQKVDAGKDQMSATVEVAQKYQSELQDTMKT